MSAISKIKLSQEEERFLHAIKLIDENTQNTLSVGNVNSPVFFQNGKPVLANTIPIITVNNVAATSISYNTNDGVLNITIN